MGFFRRGRDNTRFGQSARTFVVQVYPMADGHVQLAITKCEAGERVTIEILGPNNRVMSKDTIKADEKGQATFVTGPFQQAECMARVSCKSFKGAQTVQVS